MEVHHHSHTESPPAGRAGKKWTHYFWEFFMFFLAVSDMRSILRQRVVQVFDTKVFTEMNEGAIIIRPPADPKLFTNDASLLNALSGDIQYLKRIHPGTNYKLTTIAGTGNNTGDSY